MFVGLCVIGYSAVLVIHGCTCVCVCCSWLLLLVVAEVAVGHDYTYSLAAGTTYVEPLQLPLLVQGWRMVGARRGVVCTVMEC